MNRILVVLAIFLRLCHSQEYVPGTPGADWTLQEVLAVKSKLQTVFGTNGGYRARILKLKHYKLFTEISLIHLEKQFCFGRI